MVLYVLSLFQKVHFFNYIKKRWRLNLYISMVNPLISIGFNGGEGYPISPSSYWMMLIAVIGAVSVRRIRGPNDIDLNPFSIAAVTSFLENPPSGPTRSVTSEAP
jgi:hypothetical protein